MQKENVLLDSYKLHIAHMQSSSHLDAYLPMGEGQMKSSPYGQVGAKKSTPPDYPSP